MVQLRELTKKTSKNKKKDFFVPNDMCTRKKMANKDSEKNS